MRSPRAATKSSPRSPQLEKARAAMKTQRSQKKPKKQKKHSKFKDEDLFKNSVTSAAFSFSWLWILPTPLSATPLVWDTCPFGPLPIYFPHFPVSGIHIPKADIVSLLFWLKAIRRAQPAWPWYCLCRQRQDQGALGFPRTDLETPGLKEQVWLSTPSMGQSIPLHPYLLSYVPELCPPGSQKHFSLFIKILPSITSGGIQAIFSAWDSTSHHSFFLVDTYLSVRCQFRGLFLWEVLLLPTRMAQISLLCVALTACIYLLFFFSSPLCGINILLHKVQKYFHVLVAFKVWKEWWATAGVGCDVERCAKPAEKGYIYTFFGCFGSSLLHVGFLWLQRAGATLRCGARASYCSGFSCCRAWALGGDFSNCSTQASVVVAHGLSCSAACGIFLDQGSNPCPLHWQGDS